MDVIERRLAVHTSTSKLALCSVVRSLQHFDSSVQLNTEKPASRTLLLLVSTARLLPSSERASAIRRAR